MNIKQELKKITPKMIVRDFLIATAMLLVFSCVTDIYKENKTTSQLTNIKETQDYSENKWDKIERIEQKYKGLDIYFTSTGETQYIVNEKCEYLSDTPDYVTDGIIRNIEIALTAIPKDIFESVGDVEMYIVNEINDNNTGGFSIVKKVNDKNIVVINANSRDMVDAIRHELMHVFEKTLKLEESWNYEGDYVGKNYVNTEASKEFATNYAMHSKGEDIAETFMMLTYENLDKSIFNGRDVLYAKSVSIIEGIKSITNDYEWKSYANNLIKL